MKNQYGMLTKSNRALIAEDMGLVTYSKLSAWQKRAVKAGAVSAAEWHHTSAAANKTFYYNLEDFEELNPDNFKAIKSVKAEQADINRLLIKITYQSMVSGFSSRRKKFETVTVEGLDIRKSDGVIIGAGGRRLSSNNDSVEFFYKKPRARNFTKISKREAEELGYKFS